MEDTSFLYFTQSDIIEKINIDPRLVDSFKRVMAKLQEYYNSNGYTKLRNFREYLQKYLLDSGENNLRIYINEIDKNVGGFYKKRANEICININKLKGSTERLDSTLCHEFTHFLVTHSLTKDNSDPEILYGGFINESLTEMMTQQMYPNSNAYDAQVAMQKFANLLSGKVNNYSRFLQGFVDARWSSPLWVRYLRSTNAFQKDFDEKGYINLKEARNNSNFIDAQRSLIELFVKPQKAKSFEEYCESIKKLIDRPVPDKEYINQIVATMDKTMIESFEFNNANINEFLKQKLVEVRELIKQQKENESKRLYEFTFAGKKLAIDENLNITGNVVGIQRGWNPSTRIMTFQLNGEKMQLNVDELDFDLREKEIQSKLEELSSYYSKEAKKNMSMLEVAMQQSGELSKIEKFTLPIVGLGGKKTPYTIYVATYGDKIVILNNYEQIKNVSDIRLNEFIGVTSRNSKVGAIYSKELGKIQNGIMFSTLNEKQVLNKAINHLVSELDNSLSQEELAKYIEKYKSSNSALDEDEEMLRDGALLLAANEKLQSLTEVQKQELFGRIKEQNDRFVISTKDGKIDVSMIFGNEIITAFKGENQVLYDANGLGLYNTIFEEIRSKIVSGLEDLPSLSINSKGNIQIKGYEEQSPQEKLADINKKLEGLREQYGTITTQMEDLMKRNQQSLIPNYQEQLEKLVSQRDQISGKMSSFIEPKRSLEEDVKKQEQFKHNQIISLVEKMLSVRITSTAGYEYDDKLKAPKILFKDTITLRKEQGVILQRLEQLYYNDSIDLETYKSMKAEVLKEYNAMIVKTPKSIQTSTRDDSTFEQKQEQVPISPTPVQHQAEEKVIFDKKEEQERQSQQKFKSPQAQKKAELEEERRDLRRKQFEERAKAMGLEIEQIVDLEGIFGQQEMIEQQNIEEVEEIEQDHGMTM